MLSSSLVLVPTETREMNRSHLYQGIHYCLLQVRGMYTIYRTRRYAIYLARGKCKVLTGNTIDATIPMPIATYYNKVHCETLKWKTWAKSLGS